MANFEQMKKIVSLITRDITFGKDVCDLVLGVNVTDLEFGVQSNPVKQPIQSNSLGPWNMSHCKASSLYDHLDHCFVVCIYMHNKASLREELTFEETKSTLSRSSIFP